ncbi:MAG: DUF2058 family protein [Myxococcota bacterium]
MSSLRDQLLKKGLVDKKRKRRIDRELRDARKQDQGARKTKREREAEAAAAARAEAEADQRARSEERDRQRAKADALQRRLRARNLVLGNRIDPGRGQRFFYPKPDGHIGELDVSSGVAFQLRCGELALAVLEDRALDHVFVVKRKAATALRDIAPQCVRFFVADAQGLSAPDLAFHQRDWPVELGPHKATPEDLARFRAATR